MARNLNRPPIWKLNSDNSIQTEYDPLNYIHIDSVGRFTFVGTAQRKLTIRPDLDFSSAQALGKPTPVVVGAWNGWSLPIHNNDNEELFYTQKAPERWNGTTDPKVKVLACLTGAEDVGDVFKLQLSYAATDGDTAGVISSAVTDVEIQQAVITGRAAAYDKYWFTFPLDADLINAGDKIGVRVRRIAATGTAVSGEIIILDTVVEYHRDKLGGDW